MYNPIKDGINKKYQSVTYNEQSPPDDLKEYVHSYWEIKTHVKLEDDFILHVIPDACINILFNLLDTSIAAITYRHTDYVALNLGKSFHYTGIQLYPGVWHGDFNEVIFGFVDSPYLGNLPLIETAKKIKNSKFHDFNPIFSELVRFLISKESVRKNSITEKILSDLETIESVEDMAASVNLSARQLQRKLKETTGFSPHNFLKILRLQQSFRNHYLDLYVDQSHFIHNFKKITGYTPKEYFKNFDV
ncbi:helix-turn-helix domain-containing protein [Leptospira kanakyensis]|uniref:helix-turn-helix domain-containing protein n=1 Tax=Leptospira kanakyensis TaxID=2484968 RepID=UPI00223D43E4|nr:AraC family transcriptional regulator [Leptospira kanakyensis]MCW7468991.1 AraC family transcriptional regulator [Leptospira kanakyensis]